MTAKEILYHLPEKVAPEAIEGMETRFHFDLEGEGGGQVTVSLEDNTMKVDEGLIGTPKCKIKSSAEHFVKLCNGDLNPMMAVMTGKVKISNTSEMMKYARVFGFI